MIRLKQSGHNIWQNPSFVRYNLISYKGDKVSTYEFRHLVVLKVRLMASHCIFEGFQFSFLR